MLGTIKKHLLHAVSAFVFSLHGLRFGISSETAFKQEFLGLFILPLVAWCVGFDLGYILVIIVAWLAVMAFEMLNIGIESLSDLVSPEFNPLIKRAKDAGSAAVFLMLCANAILWIFLCDIKFNLW